MYFGVGDPPGNGGADLIDIVLDQVTIDQYMPGGLQQIGQGLSRGVGVEGACIADGQHGNVQGFKCALRQMGHVQVFP
ncbi:hypothetical protein D3C84_1193170 [compost metagenome]